MTDSNALDIQFQWTFDVHRRSQGEGQPRTNRFFQRLLFALAFVAAVALLASLIQRISGWPNLIAGAISFAVVVISISCDRFFARRRFRRRPDADMQLKWRATEDSLVASGGEVATRMRWRDFRLLRRTRTGVVLYPRTVKDYYFFPITAFPDSGSLAQFIAFARRAGVAVELPREGHFSPTQR